MAAAKTQVLAAQLARLGLSFDPAVQRLQHAPRLGRQFV
jgi:hypothetical protein